MGGRGTPPHAEKEGVAEEGVVGGGGCAGGGKGMGRGEGCSRDLRREIGCGLGVWGWVR